MSMALLGESFDIHCGGVDNIFPHHENEIAQSEAATGKRFATLWCHSAHLRIGGEKMAKSAGNFSTLHDLLAGDAPVPPSALRYLLAATAHYRKPLTFGEDVVHMSIESVDRIAALRDRLAALVPGEGAGIHGMVSDIVTRGRTGFEQAMDSDLNLPEAMGFAHTAIRDANRALDGGSPSADGKALLEKFLHDIDDVVGVLELVDRERSEELGPDEQGLLDQRAAARAAKRWADSDSLRDQLRVRGIAVEDTAQGQRWRRER
jgi:cysteinyl-tRNA synthetase